VIVPCPCGGAIGANKVQFSRSRRAEEAVVAVAVSSTGPKTQTTLQLHCKKRYTGKHMKEDEHCAGLGWAGYWGSVYTDCHYLSQPGQFGWMHGHNKTKYPPPSLLAFLLHEILCPTRHFVLGCVCEES
jgi:hypothetical protein